MKNTYNDWSFEEIVTELTLELRKMELSELQDFKEEWLEALQMLSPKAKNFCNRLVDIMISIKKEDI